eukprot:TRINITY_DN1105_c0_g1_i1.p1 TRINITY_DN1105_c0_g1~~TRINITY_DN1105_c0_g1_i1.p1  ORF type:complete len:239 (-),score=29.78 TRINITY_DN1105_c0_g1_i1:78-794(-)
MENDLVVHVEGSNNSEPNYTQYFREYTILIEYKHLPKYVPSGVYVIPSSDSLSVWHGVIFIRQGIYRGGIFRFVIHIPPTYPDQAPTVKFFTPIYHPRISTLGDIDLSIPFPTWTAHKNYIWQILVYIKRLFYIIEHTNPANTEASELYATSPEEFIEQAKQSVQNSINNVHKNPPNSSIRFNPYDDEIHRETYQKLFGKKNSSGMDLEGALSSIGTMFSVGVSKGFSGLSKIVNIPY